MASTIASIFSWLSSASSSQACLARRASARASAMDARSRLVWAALRGSTIAGWLKRLREYFLHLGVRARDDVDRDELAYAARGGGARVGGGFHRAHIATAHDRDVAGADVFLADQDHVGGLDHRVRGLDRADQAARFDESECI